MNCFKEKMSMNDHLDFFLNITLEGRDVRENAMFYSFDQSNSPGK